jgi:hypothetical protein
MLASASTHRFIRGSTQFLKVALGKGESDEWKPNLHKMSETISGSSGLFFTNLPQEEVGFAVDTAAAAAYA